MKTRVLALMWLDSIVMAVAGTWWVAYGVYVSPGRQTKASPPASLAAPAVRAPDKTEAASAQGSVRLRQLEQENAALASRVSELESQLADAESDRLRLALAQAIRSVMEAPPRGDPCGATWAAAFSALQQEDSDHGQMAQAIRLVADMARLGPAAITFLANIVTDPARDRKERETALEVLTHIRDKAALAALLKLREPDIMELDYPYDLINVQLSALPTHDVREFIPEIRGQIASELGADTIAPERVEALVLLALVHGDSESWALLRDARVLNDNVSGALRIAADVHSSRAREFVEWVAQRHPDDSIREHAAYRLQEW